MTEATCAAPVNIAVVKYWGKRDVPLILPTNSSLSVTISQDHLAAKTTARADSKFTQDKLWLNGKEEVIGDTGRMAACLKELRKERRKVEAEANSSDQPLSDLKLHIVSYNDFPTAAGLASSAAGFAALVYTVATLYKLQLSPSDLSRIARQGSGSACRSLFGGFVAWEMGCKADGSDSLAVQVAPKEHWPEMHAVICVVSAAKKGTSSTAGMQNTVATSDLLQHRIKSVVPSRMQEMSQAILSKDFDTFAQLTIRDSNSFHACCLDTTPPIFYMNDVSKSIIALVTELNRASVAAGKGYVAAYTFDAGPNAVIYTLEKDVKALLSLLVGYFPQSSFKDRFQLFPDGLKASTSPLDGFNSEVIIKQEDGAVKELIHTCVGDGPRVLGAEASLIDLEGNPKAA